MHHIQKLLAPLLLISPWSVLAQSLPTSAPSSAPASIPATAPASTSQPATSLAAPEEPAPSTFLVTGFVDVFASFNANQPADRVSFIPGTGTAAKRANELGLNLASLSITHSTPRVGFVFGVGVGPATEVVHAGEPAGVVAGIDVYRLLQQASVQVKASEKLGIEAGVFPSHIGFEVFPTKDNWNYTRAWIGELSPYYSTGVKVSYAFSEKLSGQLHALNGWQIISDNNDGKAFGTQLAYSGEKFFASFNTFLGPELAGDNRSLRGLVDVVMIAKLGEMAQLALSADAAFQQIPGQGSAPWYAMAGWLRISPKDSLAFALRGEVFFDEEGGISGVAQTLAEGTATIELRPLESLIIKAEGRFDTSTANTFSGPDVDGVGAVIGVSSQVLALLGAVVSF